jgi:hypothetical protein
VLFPCQNYTIWRKLQVKRFLGFFEKALTKVKGKFAKGNDPEIYTDENGLAKQSGSVVPITWPWQFFSLIYNCSTNATFLNDATIKMRGANE